MSSSNHKKRGRKPKGGKIIANYSQEKNESETVIPVILHLKCNLSDLNNDKHIMFTSYENTNTIANHSLKIKTNIDTDPIPNKLKSLAIELNKNQLIKNKSDCFWCTYGFDTPTVYIPKLISNNKYHCYGCFCSPECACAYLFNEQLDSNVRFERYHLLHNLYSNVYNYERNIQPAPIPHYTLDKYYGNLSIDEYRKLHCSDKLVLLIDKPITGVLPELHEDNFDFVCSSYVPEKFSIKKQRKIYPNQ